MLNRLVEAVVYGTDAEGTRGGLKIRRSTKVRVPKGGEWPTKGEQLQVRRDAMNPRRGLGLLLLAVRRIGQTDRTAPSTLAASG